MYHLVRFRLRNRAVDNADESFFDFKDNRALAYEKTMFLLKIFCGQGAEHDPVNFKLKEYQSIYSVHPFQIEEVLALRETIEQNDILTNTGLKGAYIVATTRELP